ncbi:MAG: hypothetical protein ACUVUR_02400 [bacterium]
MPEPIFSISGLRGIVGENLLPQTVQKMAGCYGRLFGPGRFVLGRDSRPSSAELAGAARAGLFEIGCEIVDLGVCPTPTVVHFVRSEKGVNGGVVITASHNPIDWNGMKFIHSEGRFILPDEFEALKTAWHTQTFDAGVFKTTQGYETDGIAGHIQAIKRSRFFKDIDVSGLRIGIDAVNGAASEAAKELLHAFGCEAVELFCSPEDVSEGFPRQPEPTAENLSGLCELVRSEGLDGGFAFDPDGDRFSCVDEAGVPLGEEASLCLACLYLLPQVKSDVVINLSTSRAVEDVCERFGVRVLRTKVGEANVVQKMLDVGARLGGEGNGGVIVPEINLCRDGLIAAAIVLGLLFRTRKRLSEIRAELPDYYMVKTTVDWDNRAGKTGFIQEVSGVLPSVCEEDFTEGVRLNGDGWWVHIRPSNTESKIRIVAEARSEKQAKEVADRVKSFIEDESF